MCVILNFKTMEIVDIIDGRTKKAWSSYTQIIDKKELAKVKYISIDMYETYRFREINTSLGQYCYAIHFMS